MPSNPNILLLWTDEQRADTLACYGNDQVYAPHLNRLAAESFVFQHAYCTQPICTPSRASVLTGQWPHTHGCTDNNMPLPAATATLAEMLAEDYDCAYIGKWHLGDEVIPQHGFSTWVSIEDMYRRFYSRPEYREIHSDYHHFLIRSGFVPNARDKDDTPIFTRSFSAVMAERYTKAAFTADAAREYLRRRDTARPFFLSVNMLEPHMPYFGPLNWMYDPAALQVGPVFSVSPEQASLRNQLLAAHYEVAGESGLPLRTADDWRRVRANYYGLVSLVDAAMGRILAALAETGQADNTIVVFTSDHGDMMGDHALTAKSVLYEEAVQVPLLVRLPGLDQQQHMVEGRISQVDLAPTLLELVGASVPAQVQGVSRMAVFTDPQALRHNDVVVEINGEGGMPSRAPSARYAGHLPHLRTQRWRSIITGDGWKLNVAEDGEGELYDLTGDPGEMTNLFAVPGQRERIEGLLARLRRWQAKTGDEMPLPH